MRSKWNLIANKSEILHWSSRGETTWFDIAKEIGFLAVKIGIIKKAARVIPIKTHQFPTLAKRPKYSVLECSSTSKIIDLSPLDWKTELYNVLIQIDRENHFKKYYGDHR